MKLLIGLLITPFILIGLAAVGLAAYFVYDRTVSYAPHAATVVAVREGCRRQVPLTEHVRIFQENWSRPTVGFIGALTLMGIVEVAPCKLLDVAVRDLPHLRGQKVQRFALVRLRYQPLTRPGNRPVIGTLELAMERDEPLPAIGSERIVRARTKPAVNALIAFILYRWNHGNLLPA